MLFALGKDALLTGASREAPVNIKGYLRNAILAMQSLLCYLCNAIFAMQSSQCNLCFVIFAMQTLISGDPGRPLTLGLGT